ncbi:uncharacterized protein, partial [Centruroides vittatus]|uniref:uncharacterized protein n=1 Tax=Centruroides vittatus TaxID=120091 RepID=UPI00350EAC6A
MPKPLSKELRELIIKHREEGKTIEYIAECLKISTRVVSKIIQQHKETESLSPKKKTGRPRLTTPAEDASLQSSSQANPFKTARKHRNELNLSVSVDTVKRRLRQFNLFGQWAAKKQTLSIANQFDHLGFAQQYSWWDISDWENVIFSDEMMFSSDTSGK